MGYRTYHMGHIYNIVHDKSRDVMGMVPQGAWEIIKSPPNVRLHISKSSKHCKEGKEAMKFNFTSIFFSNSINAKTDSH